MSAVLDNTHPARSGDEQHVLLIGHLTSVRTASAVAGDIWPEAAGRIDLLPYGRSSETLTTHAQGRVVSFPAPSGVSPRSALRCLRSIRELRAAGYRVVAVSQPSLGRSRARGLLLAFSHLLTHADVVILDPAAGRLVRSVGRATAAADLVRWLLLRLASEAVAWVGTALLSAASSGRRARSEPMTRRGSVVYLRTDVDLALAPLLAGGSVAHTVGVLAALVTSGREVELWSTGDLADVPPAIRKRRLRVMVRGNLATEIAELLSGLRQALAARRGKTSEVAFIYQRYSLNNLAGALLAARWRVPLILEANGSEAKWRSDWASLQFPALARATERALLRRADRIVAVSENAARDLVAAGGPADRIRVVPNGVEVDRFANARPASLPFPDDSFVITFVGLFYPWHGVRYLAEAFIQLLARAPNARLVLVGDGEEAALVQGLLQRAGCEDAANLPGLVARQDVPGYLAASDVLVSPHAKVRDFIGSPIKMFEYMASGRPIVASRVAQIGEILRHEETALLVEPEDPEALADALMTLRNNEALGARLGANAQEEARRLHSWEARVEAILAPAS